MKPQLLTLVLLYFAVHMMLLLPALFIVSMAFAQLDLLVTPALPTLALNTNKGVLFLW